MKKSFIYKYFILSIFFTLSNNSIDASEEDNKALKISTDA